MSFRVANDIIIDETDLTTSDVTSEILDCTNIYGLSLQVIATGTISGQVVIDVSNDKQNWVELSSPSPVAVSNTTNSATQMTEMFYKWARLRYEATSGTTNTLKVWLTSKGI